MVKQGGFLGILENFESLHIISIVAETPGPRCIAGGAIDITGHGSYSFGQKWYFSAIFGIQLSNRHVLCCKIISQNNLKLKVRTQFPDVWGEYKYHGNPYIYRVLKILCPCFSSPSTCR